MKIITLFVFWRTRKMEANFLYFCLESNSCDTYFAWASYETNRWIEQLRYSTVYIRSLLTRHCPWVRSLEGDIGAGVQNEVYRQPSSGGKQFKGGSRILKWGVNFCNNVREIKYYFNIWGIKKKKEEGSEKGGVGVGWWKFTHFTSAGSAPEALVWTGH